jgi:hypothetical protein
LNHILFSAEWLDQTKRSEESESPETGTPETGSPETDLHPPPRIATLAETVAKFPGVRHQWLCEGRLLHLLDPLSPDNMGWVLFRT